MKILSFRRIPLIVALLWFLGATSLLAASLLTSAYSPGLWAELYFVAVSVLSPFALMAFGWDKWQAGRSGPRIPEKTLHLLSLLGGWPGAICGQQLFRHKTIKPIFRSILLSIAAVHIGIVVFRVLYHFAVE